MIDLRLVVDGVFKSFPGAEPHRPTWPVLAGIDFGAARGEFVVVTGPSGCGKTTLIDVVAGFTECDRGRVLVDGHPVTAPGRDRVVVFQTLALFEWMTARDNVAFPLKAMGVPALERRRIADAWLRRVLLGGFGDRYPHELSGGMRQRLALARALAAQPSCVLLDEPLAALDSQLRRAMQDELVKLWREHDRTVVMVTHDLDEAVFLADRVVVLSERPSCVRAIVPIDLPVAREERSRASPRFRECVEHLWGLLRSGPATAP
ncbi:MAG TPA: ABC transporter ATP-binding protein [Gemmatimonadaceae bacterium]|nr:ABC transporter ATP-binding protein [Gemmatimonadaceae bacterium]